MITRADNAIRELWRQPFPGLKKDETRARAILETYASAQQYLVGCNDFRVLCQLLWLESTEFKRASVMRRIYSRFNQVRRRNELKTLLVGCR